MRLDEVGIVKAVFGTFPARRESFRLFQILLRCGEHPISRQMFKLFVLNNGKQTLKTLTGSPKFHIPFSQLHNPRNALISNPAIDFVLDEVEEFQSSNPVERNSQLPVEHAQAARQSNSEELSSVQISHPWPEWVELMGQLLKKGYFDEIGNPFGNQELGAKDSNQIRSACLNFARHRFDLIRFPFIIWTLFSYC